ncbi:MAG: bifunctional N(6)-L-threonylcarbamoyladenine synthase/serine/threonine protein kinase [Candidatus Heimdallarchaeum aukensis]|uniref:tRNA N6-adenosine threonylcarbamoyltransferase n=1 Tax=Candidatus Heimdallarchaeum aukensis TaxID=2876573 RepID=A0A9Y1BN93_9ARCH|nr:MAG: bifunctional N(6)-L-threonylcarbamoyladenine synthase/serine/threonine protein kinase [Candidatus Heimdallarchaeum aukensis]
MLSLGIESSADKLGVGIIDNNGNILANVRRTYKPPLGSGIHPREASEFHAKNIPEVISEALKTSKLTMDNIDIISFTKGPGLGPCLRVGAVAARTLALKYKKPLVGVNHPIAHVEIGRLVGNMDDPVVLYVSGGNTQIIAFSEGRYRVFGETIDIPVGNCLDVFGRNAGLSDKKAPMGRVIELLAENGTKYIPIPYVIKGMDVSFSGILTHISKLLKKKEYTLEDLSYSLQETVFAMLVEVTERALAHTKKNEVLVCGGVASNNRLKAMLKVMAESHGARFFGLEPSLAIDNGLMIAWLGLIMYNQGYSTPLKETIIDQHYRVEDVVVNWRNEN